MEWVRSRMHPFPNCFDRNQGIGLPISQLIHSFSENCILTSISHVFFVFTPYQGVTMSYCLYCALAGHGEVPSPAV